MSPHLRALDNRLSRIESRLVEQDQRLARTVLHGKVHETREQDGDWQVRLDLGRDPDAAEPVLSPWVPAQPVSAGALKVKVKPSAGERMTLLSPSGVVGSGSWAVRGPYDEDHPAPEGRQDVVAEVGKTRITIEDDQVVISTDGARVTLAGDTVRITGKVEITGDSVKHNGVEIGERHKHEKTAPGAGISGPPEGGKE